MKKALKFILAQLAKHKWKTIFVLFLAVLEAGITAITPLLYGRTIDLAIAKEPLTIIFGIVGIWLGLRLFSELLQRNIWYHGALIADRIGVSTAIDGLARFLHFPISFHEDKKSQEVANKIDEMRWEIANVIRSVSFDIIPIALTFTAISIALFTIEWRIGIIMVVMVLLFILAMWYWMPKEVKAQKKYFEASHDAFSSIWDAMRNIFVVKTNTGELFERKRLERGGAKILKKDIALEKITRKRAAYRDSIIAIGTLALLSVGIYDVWSGLLTPGQFTSVMGYTFSATGFISWSAWVFGAMTKMQSVHDAYKTVVDLPEEDYESGKAIEIKGAVSFEHVSFQYDPAIPLIKHVSVDIAEGERIALVGESGKGKTTLIKLLGRFIDPTKGAILIDGRDVHDIKLHSLRSQLAYVPQELTLFHDSLEKNLTYGLRRVSQKHLKQVLRDAQLEPLIKRLPKGVKTVVGERGLKLSAGERQRVAIARAMLREPKILILDEPTSNLDAKTESLIQVALDKLMEGRTTIVIAHRLRTIKSVDRILVLDRGEIVEQGSYKELSKKTRGAFYALQKLQQET